MMRYITVDFEGQERQFYESHKKLRVYMTHYYLIMK